MTTFVLPGDAIPLPADPVDPSTSQSITFGPGIGASTLKTGSEVISVATKMGPVHNTAKRRKTKDGPTEVNRLWVEVQSKRVGRLRVFALSAIKAKANIVSHVVLIVCTSTRRGCHRNHRTEARRRFPSRYRRRSARPIGTVCIRGSEQEDETEIRRKSCGSAQRL